ncbi:MAG: hypothetical protein K9I85_16175 [Saprospiraceae bacterium]|nr:hypothetical protein [Saprospiraceae bacterium]
MQHDEILMNVVEAAIATGRSPEPVIDSAGQLHHLKEAYMIGGGIHMFNASLQRIKPIH